VGKVCCYATEQWTFIYHSNTMKGTVDSYLKKIAQPFKMSVQILAWKIAPYSSISLKKTETVKSQHIYLINTLVKNYLSLIWKKKTLIDKYIYNWNIYMLFAGWEVRIVKNCDRGLENGTFSSQRHSNMMQKQCNGSQFSTVLRFSHLNLETRLQSSQYEIWNLLYCIFSG